MKSGSAQGVLAMFIAVAAFSLMDALLKVFAAHYPPLQVTAMRAAASLPFVFLPLVWTGRLSDLRPSRLGLHLLRALLGMIMLGTFIYALRNTSLASVYSVYMAAPLLVAALAAWWLAERVSAGQWLAIIVGFVGVLIILQPRPDGLSLWTSVAAAASALCYAFVALIARVLARTETSSSMVCTYLVFVLLTAGALAASGWVAIRSTDWGLLVVAGGLGWVGQHYITKAFRHSPAAVVAPIEYTAILWGILIDWAVWTVLPNGTMLWGAGLVIAAGVYVAWRENRSHDTPATQAGADQR
jgi:drug/metabolite transporter (DMT)-like permease